MCKRLLKLNTIGVLAAIVLVAGFVGGSQPTLASAPMRAGDRLTFGCYQGEAIEWRVLAVEDDRALVISENILDAKPYNETDTQVTWETSMLRAWLNEDFYNAAFAEAEKARILETNVANLDNPDSHTQGESDTRDKVFLLSIDEAEQLFENDKDRRTMPTKYAIQQIIISGMKKEALDRCLADFGGHWWWLRSPGQYDVTAARVLDVGSINEFGLADLGFGGVRPALWLSQ